MEGLPSPSLGRLVCYPQHRILDSFGLVEVFAGRQIRTAQASVCSPGGILKREMAFLWLQVQTRSGLNVFLPLIHSFFFFIFLLSSGPWDSNSQVVFNAGNVCEL